MHYLNDRGARPNNGLRGFILLSKAYLASPYAHAELRKAIDKAKLYRRSNVVPVIVEKDVPTPQEILHLAPFDLTAGDFDERVQLLIRQLNSREHGNRCCHSAIFEFPNRRAM